MRDIYDKIREAGEHLSEKIDEIVEDFKKQINETYEEGFKADLQKQDAASYSRGYDDGYKRAHEDGKASIDKGCEGCKWEGQTEYEEPCMNCSNAFPNKYEPLPKDEICFGDEIVVNGERGVVVSHGNKGSDTLWALLNGYRTPQIIDKNNYAKTGRHFGIEEIMEAMKNG